jgi:hypothetical protein
MDQFYVLLEVCGKQEKVTPALLIPTINLFFYFFLFFLAIAFKIQGQVTYQVPFGYAQTSHCQAIRFGSPSAITTSRLSLCGSKFVHPSATKSLLAAMHLKVVNS